MIEVLWSVSCLLQVCTRCLIKQKEDELSTQKALSAIEQARTGRGKCKYERFDWQWSYLLISYHFLFISWKFCSEYYIFLMKSSAFLYLINTRLLRDGAWSPGTPWSWAWVTKFLYKSLNRHLTLTQVNWP